MSRNRKRIPKSLRRRIYERDGHVCVECGIGADKMTLSIDHIVPLCLGGTDDESNLRVLCCPCNGKKGMAEWFQWREAQNVAR